MNQPSQSHTIGDVAWLHYDVIDSTSNEAKRIAEKGDVKKTLITAVSQTKGHGRYGREWVSPPGNVYSSLLLPVNTVLEKTAELSFVAALAVGNALEAYLPESADLNYKWPNDILVNDRKIAGILLESFAKAGETQADWIIIGVGINISHAPDIADKPCVALNQVSDKVGDECITAINNTLVTQIEALKTRWETEGFEAIRTLWMQKMWQHNKSISVQCGDTVLQGICEGISDKGELLLKDAQGQAHVITAGEVIFGNNNVSVHYAPRY